MLIVVETLNSVYTFWVKNLPDRQWTTYSKRDKATNAYSEARLCESLVIGSGSCSFKDLESGDFILTSRVVDVDIAARVG